MNKLALLLVFLIAGLVAEAGAAICTASATECEASAAAVVPAGGTCTIIESEDTAAVIIYNAAGEIVGHDFDFCRPAGIVDPC